jgi:tRNA(fMet)-specific endonuclease VapC
VSRYLIDTNILSEPLKPQPNAGVMEQLELNTEEIAIASVTLHEIRYGMKQLPLSRRRTQIEQYLKTVQETFPILAYDRLAAEWHADERARLKVIGKTPPFADGQIAAIAIANQLILVTRNRSDFENFEGLQIEDWFC